MSERVKAQKWTGLANDGDSAKLGKSERSFGDEFDLTTRRKLHIIFICAATKQCRGKSLTYRLARAATVRRSSAECPAMEALVSNAKLLVRNARK